MHIKYGYDGAMAGHFFDTLNDQWKVEDEDLTDYAEIENNGDETWIFDADQDLRMTVKKVVWDNLLPDLNKLMEEISKFGHLRIHPTATPTGMEYFIGLYAQREPIIPDHLWLQLTNEAKQRIRPFLHDAVLFEVNEAPSIEEGLKAVASFLENDYEG